MWEYGGGGGKTHFLMSSNKEGFKKNEVGLFGTEAEVLCAACPAHLVEQFHVRVDYGVGNVRL